MSEQGFSRAEKGKQRNRGGGSAGLKSKPPSQSESQALSVVPGAEHQLEGEVVWLTSREDNCRASRRHTRWCTATEGKENSTAKRHVSGSRERKRSEQSTGVRAEKEGYVWIMMPLPETWYAGGDGWNPAAVLRRLDPPIPRKHGRQPGVTSSGLYSTQLLL